VRFRRRLSRANHGESVNTSFLMILRTALVTILGLESTGDEVFPIWDMNKKNDIRRSVLCLKRSLGHKFGLECLLFLTALIHNVWKALNTDAIGRTKIPSDLTSFFM
jgi:hypothetical protein